MPAHAVAGRDARAPGGRVNTAVNKMQDETPKHIEPEEPPPFGGSWKNLYAAVLINLAALVALFYLFTRAFR